MNLFVTWCGDVHVHTCNYNIFKIFHRDNFLHKWACHHVLTCLSCFKWCFFTISTTTTSSTMIPSVPIYKLSFDGNSPHPYEQFKLFKHRVDYLLVHGPYKDLNALMKISIFLNCARSLCLGNTNVPAYEQGQWKDLTVFATQYTVFATLAVTWILTVCVWWLTMQIDNLEAGVM